MSDLPNRGIDLHFESEQTAFRFFDLLNRSMEGLRDLHLDITMTPDLSGEFDDNPVIYFTNLSLSDWRQFARRLGIVGPPITWYAEFSSITSGTSTAWSTVPGNEWSPRNR